MTGEVQVSPAVLAEVAGRLRAGRSVIEACAGSAPGTVDAGEVTAALTSMLARVTESAATVSEALGAMAGQVGEAGAAFWETDAEVAAAYSGRPPRGH